MTAPIPGLPIKRSPVKRLAIERPALIPAEYPAAIGPPRCAAEAAAAPVVIPTTSLAMLLAGHILRDGELVLLILKPSLWWILLSSLRFIAGVLVVALGLLAIDEHWPSRLQHHWIVEAAVFTIAGRIMWATLSWMGRLYILTDLRILRLAGVTTLSIFDCPLRRVARIYLTRVLPDQMFGLATLDIVPSDESLPLAGWQSIARPTEIHETVVAAITKAKHGLG